MSENEKLDKLIDLFHSLENWNESSKAIGLNCEKMIDVIHKAIRKEETKLKIAMLNNEILALKKGFK